MTKTTTTATVTSAYGTVHVDATIDDRGIVRTESGVLLGDVDGMTRLGWEITETRKVAGSELAAGHVIVDYKGERHTVLAARSWRYDGLALVEVEDPVGVRSSVPFGLYAEVTVEAR